MRFKGQAYPVAISVIFGIYTIGFLAGTYTHAMGLLQKGFLAVAPRAPWLLNIYWDSLTLIDPLTVILLWTRPTVGIGLAVLIMFTDVIINAFAYAVGYFGPPLPGMVPTELFIQSLFATFVFVTAPMAVSQLQESKGE